MSGLHCNKNSNQINQLGKICSVKSTFSDSFYGAGLQILERSRTNYMDDLLTVMHI